MRKNESISNIECSLEDLYGVTAKTKITESFGDSDIIAADIKKGWKEGTKIIIHGKMVVK